MVRSRCNLLENNEKPSKFFLNLEKGKNNIRSIKSLKINNKLIFSQTEILEHQKQKNFLPVLIFKFRKWYKQEDLSAYLDKISIPQISNSTKIICDDELTLEEIHKAVKSLAVNKTPGIDGLPVKFYRVFWEDIKDILLNTYKNYFRKGLLTTSQRQGIINLIPKKDKDLTELKSWRPLSILNTDYKILKKVLANRLKVALPKLINADQTGYMSGRSCFENIRLISDMIEFCKIKNHPCIILLVDFEKAFDSINWTFLKHVLQNMDLAKTSRNGLPPCIQKLKVVSQTMVICLLFSNFQRD